MTTHQFTITATTDLFLSAAQVHDALDEIIADGQSVARQVADDEEATDRSRLEAQYQHSLSIAIAPGLTDQQRATIAAALYQLAGTFDAMQDLDPDTKALLKAHNQFATVQELRRLANRIFKEKP